MFYYSFQSQINYFQLHKHLEELSCGFQGSLKNLQINVAFQILNFIPVAPTPTILLLFQALRNVPRILDPL